MGKKSFKHIDLYNVPPTETPNFFTHKLVVHEVILVLIIMLTIRVLTWLLSIYSENNLTNWMCFPFSEGWCLKVI